METVHKHRLPVNLKLFSARPDKCNWLFFHFPKKLNVLVNAGPKYYLSEGCFSFFQDVSRVLWTKPNFFLGKMKGATPMKMFPLCIDNNSICCSKPSSATKNCLEKLLLICLVMSRKSLLVLFSLKKYIMQSTFC